MKLPSKVRFSDEKVKKAFLELNKSNEKNVYAWLVRAFKDIEENAFCGIQIPKRLIPIAYKKKYNINNLWKYNLPNAWRLLYSIENQEIIVVSIVLEWMDHKTYEKKFKY
jgi:mRNA-degrading endonuclease RelE of RelBE toxin-antitoxin system|tara:strand:+ start:426 stop:755 length:330 start_codon:yes stop_codon:yes gene_type:complete